MMAEKGRKQQLKTGDEADAASRYARSIVPFRRGELKQIKRRMNKRLRREAMGATFEGADAVLVDYQDYHGKKKR